MDNSENVIWKCNFVFSCLIMSLFFQIILLARCVLNIVELISVSGFKIRRKKLTFVMKCLRCIHKRSWLGENDCEMYKKEKCTCKACKTVVFVVKNANLWRARGRRCRGCFSSSPAVASQLLYPSQKPECFRKFYSNIINLNISHYCLLLIFRTVSTKEAF